ncbi:Xylose isomerase-like TIM barrel [Planctomycetes bacterium Pan216]|uniref:Xylose isomerase-like TIM barrel n=1 Tax=Kolteria novifilia TaxID=2527975 RepID=A0A518B7S1_9BACT|nr:Xylose isomerase-like TIM barrel [Planctomycetes bacterium Pan216]
MTTPTTTRRAFCQGALAGAVGMASTALGDADRPNATFRLRYILASAMYGDMPLSAILPEVHKTGADAIDLWPRVHGTQREEVDTLGVEQFRKMLEAHEVRLGGIACYRLGPLGLRKEMRFASSLGENVVLVCGARGPRGLEGGELKRAVRAFVDQLKPHVAEAEERGCTIAVENHANSLIESPDSIRWFAEMVSSPALGIAFAPHHLSQESELIANLVRESGPAVKFFYAQQHGMGSKKKLPKERELLQMPGRGPLDFKPILEALRAIDYGGYTEIFMHPVPRGVPILESASAITAEINRSRDYLDACLRKS